MGKSRDPGLPNQYFILWNGNWFRNESMNLVDPVIVLLKVLPELLERSSLYPLESYVKPGAACDHLLSTWTKPN